MSEAIEENLSTLETISKSDYSQHFSEEIKDLKEKLVIMHNHLSVLT